MFDSLNTLYQIGLVGDLSDGEVLRKFLDSRDRSAQAAFAVLVDRHGPMVLRTARRVLGNADDAEDVFQATFLLLARKAGSIRKTESVAGWLHGVARRVAARAGSAEFRRKMYERRVAKEKSFETGRDQSESWPELHEEIARLPRRYREPIVLCCLEGLTTEAAARRLGCPRGTVMSRLDRARDRLHDRLTRRGFGREDLIEGALSRFGAAAVPAALGKAAVEASSAIASGAAAQGIEVSTSVLSLARGENIAMNGSILKAAAASVLACAVGLGSAWSFGEFRQPEKAQTRVVAEAAGLDVERLQGTWKITKITMDGKLIQDRGLSGASFIFQSHELVLEGGGEATERHAFTLDPGSTPKALLLNRITPNPRQWGWMLYECQGDGLRIAFNDAFQGKPEGFDPRPELFVLQLKRDPKAAQVKATRDGAVQSSRPDAALDGAPRVVKAIPDDGAEAVDPATRELRVTFDRDMDRGGMSVVGGGPTFPGDPSARPHWIDARTIIIPIRLAPGRHYHLSINNSRFRNFRSAQGEPATPYPIDFRTAPGSEKERPRD